MEADSTQREHEERRELFVEWSGARRAGPSSVESFHSTSGWVVGAQNCFFAKSRQTT